MNSTSLFALLMLLTDVSSFQTGGFSSVSSLSPTLQFSNSIQQSRKEDESRTIDSHLQRGRRRVMNSRLYSSNGNGKFDITRPTFDLYSLRSIRGDALVRYNSLNQSEPLRINLYLIALVTCFSYSSLSEAVFDEPASLEGTVASILAGGFATFRFIRECSRRSEKLSKIEKESNAQKLPIRLPSNFAKKNPFVERPFISETVELRQVFGSGRRILAICGPGEALKSALVDAQVLRRRLSQANVLIVPVPTDLTSSVREYYANELQLDMELVKSVPFVAEADNVPEWAEYFRSLLEEDENNPNVVGKELVWFGLSSSGKSFGSGVGLPRWLEILGQSLLPMEMLDQDESEVLQAESGDGEHSARNQVLLAQKQFYKALTEGSLDNIQNVYDVSSSKQVTEVLDQGGTLDDWELCLRDGARPADLKTGDPDVLVVSDEMAYSTTIEFPLPNDPSASLLAVQQWVRSKDGDEEEWKLQLHQTIPWGPDTRAGATLAVIAAAALLLQAPDQ
eukprot:CAMPEP_0181105984 /NCGR_PEP_ID=MMETSP1071-20121207/16282_1 /TAXON_ID=35127 /ORGANISM="Thalassiosira sp., Strain NH16" /LENGTH=507 /DNA_ID=CAMNT_0023189345 /DNA_START=98 /DNA_END=1622 /DNA_ORIENTATION=+